VLAVAGLALLGGALVAVHVHRLGLTLSHYDARGHLVVARRIGDSLTPGWQQIGAIWLPLPHLLNALPVQIDVFYRTGFSAVAFSVAAFALAAGALAWLVLLLTRSHWAAIAAAAVFVLNPNVLYLQSTPMTEPLLIALTLLGVGLLTAWVNWGQTPIDSRLRALEFGANRGLSPITGVVFALACLTRYEAWPVTATALALAAWARWRNGEPWRESCRRVSAVAFFPALAIVVSAVLSRVVIGEWFVPPGFFVPENTALGHPYDALAQIGWGIRELSGSFLLAVGGAGLIVIAARGLVDRSAAWMLPPLSLAASAALPWVAFYSGHPYRIRYMVPLMTAEALGAGIIAGLARRAAPAVAVIVLAVAAGELRPWNLDAPVVAEAQWDRPNVPARDHVTRCLQSRHQGEAILASMGSLGHYMQELSRAGLRISDFLHEGNGDIWLAAIEHPRPYAGWILIEEQAEGGDVLARKTRENPHFLRGFTRVCEGAGVALYRRD
jgi:hypothetical protein